MARVYYVVAVNYAPHVGGKFGIEFGDYSRSVAFTEYLAYREQASFEPKAERSLIRFLTVQGDTQADIDAAISRLNAS